MPDQERYESHCQVLIIRSRQYGCRLEQWGKAQARWLPGDMPYEAAQRKARLAAETLEGLCEHCPYAGQEGGKPCE